MKTNYSFHFFHLTKITSSHPCNDAQVSEKNYHCFFYYCNKAHPLLSAAKQISCHLPHNTHCHILQPWGLWDLTPLRYQLQHLPNHQDLQSSARPNPRPYSIFGTQLRTKNVEDMAQIWFYTYCNLCDNHYLITLFS